MNNKPYWDELALKAVRDTGGLFVSVGDDEAAAVMKVLSGGEGIYAEPAGAVAAAGLKKIVQEKKLKNLRSAVCTVTGHGLNARSAVKDTHAMPELLPPDVLKFQIT